MLVTSPPDRLGGSHQADGSFPAGRPDEPLAATGEAVSPTTLVPAVCP